MRKLRFLLPSLLAKDTSDKDVKIKRLVDFCILQIHVYRWIWAFKLIICSRNPYNSTTNAIVVTVHILKYSFP